ncbi:hypothetical protein BGZ65_006600 [Modicella reniformis]|uniref:Superoxide dismutase copper/zinc binding domain-containing protein n=1 Tax=Modicella reniformis TaxID=1440133 RepID=A0A9P6J5S2_9FUNG|nr:hypothetical protein BGZ65_006600 [Modicella reniformis]
MKVFIISSLIALACAGMAQAQQPQEAKINMAGIKGSFKFTPLAGKLKGAKVTVSIEKGLTKKFAVMPNVGFQYHIHLNRVGPGNDCMATGGHLDPTNVGKHGNLLPSMTGAIKQFEYVDDQLEFTGKATTIVGRSVVIHNNGTRVACANLLPVKQPIKIGRKKNKGILGGL